MLALSTTSNPGLLVTEHEHQEMTAATTNRRFTFEACPKITWQGRVYEKRQYTRINLQKTLELLPDSNTPCGSAGCKPFAVLGDKGGDLCARCIPYCDSEESTRSDCAKKCCTWASIIACLPISISMCLTDCFTAGNTIERKTLYFFDEVKTRELEGLDYQALGFNPGDKGSMATYFQNHQSVPFDDTENPASFVLILRTPHTRTSKVLCDLEGDGKDIRLGTVCKESGRPFTSESKLIKRTRDLYLEETLESLLSKPASTTANGDTTDSMHRTASSLYFSTIDVRNQGLVEPLLPQ